MLTRYLELRPFIETKNAELPPYFLTSQISNQIKNYPKDLKNLESVSKKTQNEKITMENTSILFSSLFWKISSRDPIITTNLQLDSNIGVLLHFE